MPGISYDDSGSLAPYFGVTFLALLLFPFTYFALRPSKKDALQPLCSCSQCRIDSKHKSQQAGDRQRRFTRRIVPLILGWLLFAYLCYTIARAPRLSEDTVYDPFEILGLSESSSEKQIKKHYKKLSLQFHPDKIKLAGNQTKDEVEARFVELTKAYKSLTDEVTRENLAKYGNPDGPQQREEKIAIPRWVVEGKNGNWVLAAYGLVLGGGIPFIVGRWWFSQRRLTRDNILNPTAELFFHQLREDTDFLSLVTLLASALEFHAVLGGKRRGSKKVRKERQARIDELEKELETRREEWGVEESVVMRKESRVVVGNAVARRARALLWSHLLRVDLQDKELELEQIAVLRASPLLLNAMVNISLAHNWLATSLLCIKLQPCLAQGLPASVSPLTQFPGVTLDEAEKLEVVSGAEGTKWCEKFVKSSERFGEAKLVAEQWPRLDIVDAEFKVAGERLVTPSSIVQLHIRCRYIYPTTSTITPKPIDAKLALPPPNGNHYDHENGDAAKDESVTEVEDAVTKASDEMDDEKADIKEKVTELKETLVKEVGRRGKPDPPTPRTYPPNGYGHAPRWPGLRKPHYYVLLGDSKLDKVIVQPTKITDIPLCRPDGLPSEPREFSLQFQAPPQANMYSFVIYAASDTFLGSDVDRPIMLKVEDTPPDAQFSEDEDISDPEEDTLAGQMAMMRGGKVKPSAVHGDGEGGGEGESSEGEYESSSDEEGPRRGRAINEDSDSDSD